MKRFGLFWNTAILAAFTLILAGSAFGAVKTKKECVTDTQVKLQEAMRGLWDEHNTWTKNSIDSHVFGLPDAKEVDARLLKNQEEIGDAIKPYYGEKAGDKLAGLLKDHVTIASELVAANKEGDKKKAASVEDRWKHNSDEIVAFLSGANPKYWPKETLKGMMDAHLELIKKMATESLSKNYEGEIKAYDRSREHALMMADALSNGIIKAFPDKFTR